MLSAFLHPSQQRTLPNPEDLVSFQGKLGLGMEPVLDFASSERAGRRNALPNILGSPAGVGPTDLPLKLAEMSLTLGIYQPIFSLSWAIGNLGQ